LSFSVSPPPLQTSGGKAASIASLNGFWCKANSTGQKNLSVNTRGGQVLIRYLRQFYQSKLNMLAIAHDD
jgi:hypothetical protein